MAKKKTTPTKKKQKPSGKSPLTIFSWLMLIAIAMFITHYVIGGCSSSHVGKQSYGSLEKVITAPNTNETIVNYKAMTISFNSKLHIPNWVAWELTEQETEGNEPRAKKFLCDEDVPGCANDWDYSYTGYDRGHMAPAADMKWDPEAMRQSFYMTNICPQAGSLNSGAWKRLEDKCRTWAQADSAITIICGPITTDKIKEHIGDSRVAVPQRFFKVIISPYANPPRGIGFIMPNAKVPGGMQAAAVSIDSVEAVTGHDFFSVLPDEIENEIESQCKFHYWSTLKPKKRK